MNTQPTSRFSDQGPAAGHWELRFRELAASLADPSTVPFVTTPEGYGRALLHQDDQVEIIAMRWPAGVASALHGHGGSAVWLQILAGSLVEDRFLPMGDELIYQSRQVGAGQVSYLSAGALHRIVGVTDSLALHAYSPRLLEPATPPSPRELARIIAAWNRSEAALGGAPLPAYIANCCPKRSPA